MHDEFTRQDRLDSVNLLKESITVLKDSHSVLEVTSKAFKDSISKEQALFNQVLALNIAPKDNSTSTDTLNPEPNALPLEAAIKADSIKDAASSTDLTITEEIDSASIEGVMTTENAPVFKADE